MSKKDDELAAALQKSLEAYLYPPINLVHPDDCTCSKIDLRQFGFCLCGSPNPPKPKRKPIITFGVDHSSSIDDDLMKEFLELIGELPKKPKP